MASTSQSFTRAKGSRGILARACIAKTMTWRLDSAKGVLIPDASMSEVLFPQAVGETQANPQVTENHKKRLE